MKIRSLFLALASVFALSLAAQPGGGTPPSPEDRANRVVSRMVETVAIPAEQQPALVGIFTEFFTTSDKYRQNNNLDLMPELVQQRDNQVQQLLGNEALYGSYQQFMQQRGRGAAQQGQGPHTGQGAGKPKPDREMRRPRRQGGGQ